MVCNLEQQKDLKKALEEYVNVLMLEGIKTKPFNYLGIIKEIYDAAYSKNKDQVQALGVAYHVPQIMTNLFKINPDLDMMSLDGKDLDGIKDLIQKVNSQNGLDLLAKELKIISIPISQIEEEIANQPKDSVIPIETITSAKELFIDRLLFPSEINKTIGQQLLRVNGIPSQDQTNPKANLHHNVVNKLLGSVKDFQPDFTEVTYEGHTGFRLLAIKENQLPNLERNLYLNEQPTNFVVLALVDNKGNFLYFKEDGTLGDASNGTIVHFLMKASSKEEEQSIKDRLFNEKQTEITNIVDSDTSLTSEEKEAVKTEKFKDLVSYIDKLYKEKEDFVKQIVEETNTEPVLLDINSGSTGYYKNTNDMTPAQRKATQAYLSEFNLTPVEKASIEFTTIVKGNKSIVLPTIKFEDSDSRVSLKNPEKLSTDSDVLNNIVSVLVDDPKLLGIPLSAMDKLDYIKQFLHIEENSGFILTKDVLSVNGKILDIVNNKEEAREILKSFFGNNFLTIMEKPYNDNKLRWITVTSTGEITEDSRNYYDFIFQRIMPRVAMDKTVGRKGRPMIVNSYLGYKRINEKKQVEQEVKETIEKVDENPDLFGGIDFDINSAAFRSKLLETIPTTAEQEERAKKFLEESPLFKAVDESGKPLITTDFSRTIVNSDAFGMFSNAAVTLFSGASYTHGYHEAWHVFSQLYLSKGDRDRLYNRVSKLDGSFEVVKGTGGQGGNNFEKVTVKFSDLNPNFPQDRLLLEEFIAEEFRLFAINNGKFKTKNAKTNILSKIFNRIWALLKQFFGSADATTVYSNPGSETVLNEMFNTLYRAKTQDQISRIAPNLKNAEFGRLNSGIIAEDGAPLFNYQEAIELSNSIDGIISLYTDRVIQEQKAKGVIANGYVITAITSPKNQDHIYNVVVKTAFQNKLKQHMAYVEKNKENKNDPFLDVYKRNIDILSRALKSEIFGDITEIIKGNAKGNSVVAFHRENSAFKDLGLVKDYDIEIDNLDSKKAEADETYSNKGPNEKKSEDIATNETLFLVKSLLKKNPDGSNIENALGFPETVDFIPTWRVLTNKLGGQTTPTGLYNKMIKARDMKIAPYFDQLLLKVGNPAEVMSTSENAANMWISLWQSLNLYNMPILATQFVEDRDENGEVSVKIKVGKTTAEYFKIKRRDWPSKFAQETSSPYIKVNTETKANELNLPAIKKAFLVETFGADGLLSYTVNSKENWIPFLNSIGLYLTNNYDINQTLQEEDVKYIAQAIGLAEYNKLNIEAPIDFLSRFHKFKSLNRFNQVVDINYNSSVGRVDAIASLEAQYSDQYTGSMVRASSDNLKATTALNSTYTKIINSINEVMFKGDMFDNTLLGDYAHLYYLNPEFNPQAKASIFLNSLFKTDGTKDQDNSIEVFDVDGSKYVTEDFESNGVPYGKMTKLDKVITDMTSMMFYGVQEGTTRAAGKKTYLGVKIKEIKTYDGKKTNHLFIDTELFLKNASGDYITQGNVNTKILQLVYPKLEAEIKRIKMVKDDPTYYKTYKGFEKADQFAMFDDVLEQDVDKEKSLKQRLTTTEFLNAVAEKGLITTLNENEVLRDELNKQVLEYFSRLKKRYEKQYVKAVKSAKLQRNGEALLPEAIKEALKERFISNKVIKKAQLDSLGESSDILLKNAFFSSYTINSWLYKAEVGTIIHTDHFQFNHAKNEGPKRIAPYQSPGTIFATGSLANNYANTYAKREYEQKLMDENKIAKKDIRKHTSIFNTAIIKESEVRSAYYEMYEDMFRKSMIRRGITDEAAIKKELYGPDGLDKNGNPTGGRMAPFAKIKDADGQGFVSFDAYRILKKLESDWSPEQEAAYQDVIKGKQVSADEIKGLFPVYKLGYAGPLAITGRYPINSIHKFSLMPLTPSMLEYGNKKAVLQDIHLKMIEQGIDYITFESGSKQSHIRSSENLNGDDIYEGNDTSRLKENFTFTVNPIFLAYLKNQTKVNSYFKGESTLASQLRKLFNVSLYSEGDPKKQIFKEKTDKVFSLIDRIVKVKKAEILRNLKFKEVIDPKTGTVKLEGDIQVMLGFIRKELEKQGYSKTEIDLIQSNEKGTVDLSSHPLAPQIEKNLVSIINNRLVRLKVNGEPLVEGSSAFFQDVKFKKPTEKDLNNYGTNGLRSYVVDPDGKVDTKGMGVAIALNEDYQKLFFTKYFTKDEKGNYIDSKEIIAVYKKNEKGDRELDFDASFNRLNEMINVNEWLNTDENRLKIRITGVRIPVQGPNSAEFAEVQRFLPPIAGPIIIIPAEIVAKSGTDFDVDKLTSYSKYISSRGTLIKDSFNTVEELDAHIEKLEESFNKARAKAIKGEIKTEVDKKNLTWTTIKDDLSDFRKAVTDVAQTKYLGKEQYNSLTQKNTRKLLENLSDKNLMDFVKNNIPEAYKIYNQKLKDFNITELNKVEETISNLYKEKNDLAKTAIELSLAKEHKRNFSKVIENDLIDAITDVLSLPDMAEVLLTPNDTHLTKYITEDAPGQKGLKSLVQELDDETDYEKSIMTGKRNAPKGISATRMLEQDFNTDKQQASIAGGQGLGIVAVGGTNSNQFRIYGTKLKKSMPVVIKILTRTKAGKNVIEEKIVDFPIGLKLKHNKTSDGAISLSKDRDYNNENSVAEIISQLLNGFVDIDKDEWVAYLQGNPTVTPKILFLVDAGVPFEHIAYFVSNPMVREYVSLENSYKSPLSKLVFGKDHDSSGSNAKNLAKKYMMRSINVPSAEYTNNKDNVHGLQYALNFYHKGAFTLDELKSIASSRLNFADQSQKAGFLQYLLIEELMKDYDLLKMTLNPDTTTSPNMFEAKIKSRAIARLKDSKTVSQEDVNNLVNGGALKPFQVQDFTIELFGRLFPTRNHPKVIDFLTNAVENRTLFSSIEKATGLDEEKYVIRFLNSLYQYVFINTLKNYRSGDTMYKQIPVDQLVNIEQLKNDYDNKEYAKNYIERGLYPVPLAAFEDATFEEFVEFSLEREYLRRMYPIDSVVNTTSYKRSYAALKNINNPAFSTEDGLKKYAYENILKNKALNNIYNTFKLFRSGKDTVAQELINIINDNPALAKKYSVISKFKASVVPNDVKQKYKGILNFTLTDISDVTDIRDENGKKKREDYRRQMSELADPSFIKVANSPQNNAYISSFFEKLPLYAFLQSGMNPSEFNLMSIMPYGNYNRIMDVAVNNLKKLLDSDNADKFLAGFNEFFKARYNSKNSTLINRGVNWRMNMQDVINLKQSNALNINNLPFITNVKGNVYVLDDNSQTFKDLAKDYEKKSDFIYDVKNNNLDSIIISSLSDLNYRFPGMSFEQINAAKTDIDSAISNIKSLEDSGKNIVFLSSIFDQAKLTTTQLGKPYFTEEKALAQKTFRKKPLLFQQIESTRDKPVGARNIGNAILLNISLLKQKYAEKAWTKSAVLNDKSSATPLAENEFTSFDEFFTFVLLHELGHDFIKQAEGETKGLLEDRINKAALAELRKNYSKSTTQPIVQTGDPIKQITAIYNKLTDEQKKKVGTLESILDKYNELPFDLTVEQFVDQTINCKL